MSRCTYRRKTSVSAPSSPALSRPISSSNESWSDMRGQPRCQCLGDRLSNRPTNAAVPCLPGGRQWTATSTAARPRGNRFIPNYERREDCYHPAASIPRHQAVYSVIDAGMISSIFGGAARISGPRLLFATFWPAPHGDPDIPRWSRKTQMGHRPDNRFGGKRHGAPTGPGARTPPFLPRPRLSPGPGRPVSRAAPP